MSLTCTHCNKRLSRKTARQIDGVVMCSACLFAPPENRQWSYGGGTLESNVHGFHLLRGDELRKAIEALPHDDPLKQAIRDSGSGPQGGDCSQAPGEAPQSGLPQEGIAQPQSPGES